MKILSTETSTLTGSVAILENDHLIAESILNMEITHSQRLMPTIKQLLESIRLDIASIELITASIGPGSFTGLRIGLITAKTLAHSLNIPIIGISSLDVLAFQIWHTPCFISPILDAKKNEIYTSLYTWENNELIRLEDYQVISPLEWFEKIKEKEKKIIFLGNAVEMYQHEIKTILKDKCLFLPKIFSLPKASLIGLLGFKKFKKGGNFHFGQIEPMYLRTPVTRKTENISSFKI